MANLQTVCSRLLLPVLVIASELGGPRLRSWAQTTCGPSPVTVVRVENATDALALDAAVNCSDGGTVQAVWAGEITLDAPISIGSGTFLSITGEDSLAEVRGGSQTRLFDVSPSGGLVLKHLKLSGGSAASGGAIHSTSATVSLEGCEFDGNDATAGDGGALWVQGGELTVVGGEFSDNSATGNGGAVLAVDARVVIQGGTLFVENRAMVEGGALYCGGAENAITADSTAPYCSLTGAVFTSNSATLQEDVSLSSIEKWADLYGGGAAAFYRCEANLTNSVFEFNFAQVSGGGVFGGSDTAMVIDGCTFENNTTPGYGAGVVVTTATIGGGTLVTANSAGETGGGVSDSCGVSTRPGYKSRHTALVPCCISYFSRFLLACRVVGVCGSNTG